MGCCGKIQKATPAPKNLPTTVDSALVFTRTQGKKVADPNIAARRLQVCQACPFLRSKENVCTRCGCLIFAKIGEAQERCPALKW